MVAPDLSNAPIIIFKHPRFTPANIWRVGVLPDRLPGGAWKLRCALGTADFDCALVAEDPALYAGALGFMNWTSTEHPGWVEQCREFASKRMPFRLDHVSGQNEEKICDKLCAEHNFRQEKRGSAVLFTPIQN